MPELRRGTCLKDVRSRVAACREINYLMISKMRFDSATETEMH